MIIRRSFFILALLPFLLASDGWGQARAPASRPAALENEPPKQAPTAVPAEQRSAGQTSRGFQYLLGPNDQITVRALLVDEISEEPIRIDSTGHINLPMVGRVRAAGLTIDQLEQELTRRLKSYIKEPQVSVNVSEYRSQPVSVIGAVRTPGVHQLEGRKTLVEILSLAGGAMPDAGHTVKITRRAEWGAIPLPGAKMDSTGQFSLAEVKLKSIMEARTPEENIQILPYDVVSVPRAEMVYVVGEVRKPGGFVLQEKESVTVLQAVALAEGLAPTSSPKNAKILRKTPGSESRTEIAVNLKRTLEGKGEDLALQPDDILFVPNNTGRSVAIKTLETAIGLGTGILIWRR